MRMRLVVLALAVVAAGALTYEDDERNRRQKEVLPCDDADAMRRRPYSGRVCCC